MRWWCYILKDFLGVSFCWPRYPVSLALYRGVFHNESLPTRYVYLAWKIPGTVERVWAKEKQQSTGSGQGVRGAMVQKFKWSTIGRPSSSSSSPSSSSSSSTSSPPEVNEVKAISHFSLSLHRIHTKLGLWFSSAAGMPPFSQWYIWTRRAGACWISAWARVLFWLQKFCVRCAAKKRWL